MTPKEKRDQARTEITERIAAQLAEGVAPWHKPWKTTGFSGIPRNGATGRPYNGINVLILWDEQARKGYRTGDWMTYRQAKKAGANVRKGERGTKVTFWKLRKVGTETNEDGEERDVKVPLMRLYTVFNRDQIDGLPPLPDAVRKPEWEALEDAETFLDALGADLRHGGSRAAYSPVLDYIMLPPREAFPDAASYYSTSIHEHAHWSGHPSRLDRPGVASPKSMLDPSYAREELVAELTAAFVSAELGIEGQTQHPEYLGAWAKHLRDDDKALFRAAAAASRAAEFLHETAGDASPVANNEA